MAETKELSDTEKLEKLSQLINGSEGEAEEKEFTDLLNTVPVDLVSTENVRSYGTLLQDAVSENKKKFVQILLDFGADPAGTCDGKRETPMELATKLSSDEKVKDMINILAKFTEIPEKVKLVQLSRLMYSEGPKKEREAEFKNLLSSVPMDLVNSTNVRDWGTLVQDAVYENKQNFLRILLESGVSPNATCEGKKETPYEIALNRGNDDVLSILAEFSELTDGMKLIQLSYLMNKDEQKSKKMAEFENLLNSLSVDLVNSTSVRGKGTLLQYAVTEEKADFVKALLKYGADPTATCDDRETTAIEIAIKNKENLEMSVALAEVTEMPENLKFDFLRICLQNGGYERSRKRELQSTTDQFKKTLESLPLEEVKKKSFKIDNLITAMASMEGSYIWFNLVQMAAAYGKSDLLRVLLDFGLDPKDHIEGTPPPFCLAAVNGHLDAFAQFDFDDSEPIQFQLAQLLVWGMADKVPSEDFKELLGKIPVEKVSNVPLCDSTLLQHLAYRGRRTAVALILQNGVDPMVTTERSETTAEELAKQYSKVGVLVELAKVKEISADIMASDIWSKVQGEQMLAMGERICSLLEKNSL